MLPTRSQLTGWDPAALVGGGESIDTAGTSAESAVESMHIACHVVVAEDKCVAGISAAFGVAGGYAGGVAGGGFSSAGGPLAVGGAAVGSMAGSWIFGLVGTKVGEAVCPSPTS